MKQQLLLCLLALWAAIPAGAQSQERYIEVTGTSEIEIVPDKIHFLVRIREYFEEEFDGKSKPEDYRTKVPLAQIEQGLRKVLDEAGVSPEDVRTQEVGEYRRKQGQDFLVSKQFDITLHDFGQIDAIVKRADTRGIQSMLIGELENKDMLDYHRRGKIEALKAAQQKAAYLTEALGKKPGEVLRIEELGNGDAYPFTQSNVMSSDAASFGTIPTIKRVCSMRVRFGIVD